MTRPEPSLRFGILGPVEVISTGAPVQLGGPKLRTLLALLLVNANRVVPVERLIQAIWGDSPCATAPNQVQALVSSLRQRLGDRVALTTSAPGYVLRVEPRQLDRDVFEAQVIEARAELLTGRLTQASGRLTGALAIWRGPALAGATGLLVGAEAARLEERRLAVLEKRLEVDLALGRHRELVAELTALVLQHSRRERPLSLLMIALHRSGRRPDALDVYRRHRRTMVEELGLDPSQELVRLERAILNDDPALAPHAEDWPPARV